MAQAMKTPTTQVTKTTLRPLHDRILVKRLEEEDEKHGSIIIPDSAKEKPQEGKVIAVGTGKVTEDGKKLPLDVKAGDRILFGKYSGSEVKLDGEEYLIMKEEDVLGILELVTLAASPRSPHSSTLGRKDTDPWPSSSCSTRKPARRSCAASTSWRTPSRPRWAPRAGTWSSTRSTAARPSPRTA